MQTNSTYTKNIKTKSTNAPTQRHSNKAKTWQRVDTKRTLQGVDYV